ncbi:MULTISPECIES: tRNA (adenosine(37)-N6)-threonylcarbamoyltransferase complex dimerization subunit type 1 TsaB [Microbacterium]|uniref:tRNA (adenosine(37)-N6)-threonylcarbamoyltransferase complex dimerization subunit type 1 TsaB n=1 Tax=Microbacterium TaxID=33882 RepID=UPI000B93F846|nr:MULTISPECIES: tRNA (adenosine(37)-N6)-threonylcarbamoyltransferase complex dimerization subunit type 1 TsaB [Microbacterium]MDQ1218375.1 tRNA threonylcarbamoyladenosine biosynthesis protein TsaB [Microbacterium arborescens]OYC97712.1 tRNA (adenosine(37)-N6)-threonylcarbamoyltransferase complex dimerization subunit type 1 TsaB [Microbacterium sp. Yaish 1]
MILGIDTSIGTAVAIVDPAGRVRAEAVSSDPRGHAEVIGDLLVRVFGDAGVDPAEITAVAAGMGPGPFTGLRVGIAAARAFALGRGIPVVPVASHDAAARAHVDPAFATAGAVPVEGEPIAIVTDARRRELAVSVYRVENGMPVRIVDPHLVARASTEPLDLFGAPAAALSETTAISAAALARVAAQRLAAGDVDTADADTAALEPLYLRAPDVTVPAGPKKVGT